MGPLRRRVARQRHWLLPALTVVGLGLIRLRWGDFETDTSLYAGVAWQMVETGSFWTPMAGDLPYFNKPPLVLWFHAACFWLLGPVLGLYEGAPPFWAIRLPVIAQAAAAVSVSAIAVRRLAGAKAGLLTGLILAASFEIFIHLNRAIMDYAVMGLMMASVWAIARAESSAKPGAWSTLAGLPLGLALLCKPFFALGLIPIMALWLALVGRARRVFWLGATTLVAIAVALPWHASMVSIWSWTFRRRYFGTETLQRATADAGFGTDHPWWAHFETIGVRFLPWTVPLAFGLLWIATGRPLGRSRHAVLWALCWAGVWLAALAFFPEKRPRYMMHVWPALALIAAIWITRWAPAGIRGPGTRRLVLVPLAALLVGAVGLLRQVIPLDPPAPKWAKIAELTAREPETPLYHGTLALERSARVYLAAGRWPKAIYEQAIYGGARTPPENAIVIWHRGRLAEIGIAEADPSVEALIGDYAIVRWAERHRLAAGLTAETDPGPGRPAPDRQGSPGEGG